MIDLLFLLGGGFLAALLLMLLTWAFAVKKNFYSSVDVTWAMSFFLLSIGYVFFSHGWFVRKFLLGLLFCAWSGRLSLHLFLRLKNHFPEEDSRYSTLKKQWKGKIKKSALVFFLLQGLSVVFLSTPLAFVSVNVNSEQLSVVEVLAFALGIVGIFGEATADRQLKEFKRERANRGHVCDRGLWYYSRHPNYFFEAMIWCSFSLYSWSSDYGFFTILCPAAMLYLLLRVTGVPAAEKQSLASKGARYREYQKTTSVFVPWFKKSID